MSRTNKTIANIYNPLNQDKKTLLDNFVIRHKEFNKIFRDIKISKLDQTSQNFLIQGQRGSGKTTLLAKLRYEIEDSKNLSHLLAIQFSEEQYNIFSLNRLWESIADILDEINGFEHIVQEMEEFEDEEDFYFILKRSLKKNKKKLVLLIDNFGDILDKLKEKEHKKLRDILHESDLQIIAGSTRTLEAAYKHDKPFFESFKTIYLETLTKKDVQILLENLSKQYDNQDVLEIIKNQKGRIETIRRLTGGIPRTIILLYEIILDDSANVFEDLEGILDRITPLYKHKMDDLATQQQIIVDAIALNWDGMLASEISKKTKIETKKISAQLKILEKNGFVFSKHVNRKNKLYMLEERFLNIWYLMRYGRKKKKQQVLWLVRFLKDWCTQEELTQKAKNHITLAKKGELNHRGGYYMAEALSQTVQNIELKYELLTSTKKHIYKTAPEIAHRLSDPDKMVFQLLKNAYKNKDFQKAKKYLLMAVKNKDIKAMFDLALLYQEQFKDFKNAEKYYRMAIDNNEVNAMYNLAWLYHNEFIDFQKAEKYYRMAIENKEANAMNNLAVLYKNEFKDFKNAEKYYRMAIENKDVNAMNNLAGLYIEEFKDFQKAKKYYRMAIENKNVNAMFNLAWLYDENYKDFKNAEKYYRMAIENKDVEAMNNLAVLFQNEIKDFKNAEKYYLMAIKYKAVNAIFNLAGLYHAEFQDFENAKKYYLMAVEKDFQNNMEFLFHMTFVDDEIQKNLLQILNKYLTTTTYISSFALSVIMIHDEKYKESITCFNQFLNLIRDIDNFQKHITNFFILLISRKQHHLALKLFQEEDYRLKEKIKPVYYALMHLMQEEYPKEYKRMGAEISETVHEILDRITAQANAYKKIF